MNKILSLVTVAILALIICSSCSKDTEVQDINMITEYQFFLDGQEVDNLEINWDEPQYELVIAPLFIDGQQQDGVAVINAFSNDAKYIAYGLENNLRFDMVIEMENHLSNYAMEHGYIDIIENGGDASAYLEYEALYIKELHQKYNYTPLKGLCTFWRGCQEGLNGLPVLHNLAWFPFAWDNSVSMHQHLIGGAVRVYDRSFYRRHLGTVWSWGGSPVCFSGSWAFLNNRMSSTIVF